MMCALFRKAWLTALCWIRLKRNWLRLMLRIKTRRAWVPGVAPAGPEELGETALSGLRWEKRQSKRFWRYHKLWKVPTLPTSNSDRLLKIPDAHLRIHLRRL